MEAGEGGGGRGGEGEDKGKTRQGKARQAGQRGSSCADTTSYVIVWVQPVVTGSTAQHGSAQYNTTQYRNGRAKRREAGAKSRHIRSSQVRLQRKSPSPPDKNAVEGGGADGGREGHLKAVENTLQKRKLCPVPIRGGIAAVPKEKFELLKWPFGVPARRVQGPALACDLLLPLLLCYTGILRLITRRGSK